MTIPDRDWKRLCRRIGANWEYDPPDVVIDQVLSDLNFLVKMLKREERRKSKRGAK